MQNKKENSEKIFFFYFIQNYVNYKMNFKNDTSLFQSLELSSDFKEKTMF